MRDSEAPPLLGFLSPEKASEVEAEGAEWVGCEGLSQCLWLGGGGDDSSHWLLRLDLDSGSCQHVPKWQVPWSQRTQRPGEPCRSLYHFSSSQNPHPISLFPHPGL